MTDYEIAKAIHVFGVVLWIGGVSFVTFVLLPAIRALDYIENQYELFEKIEHRFAWQSRFTTLLTGLSGFYLVWKLDLWYRFLLIEFWWMHFMILIWLLFTLMLFVLEPLFLHRFLKEQAKKNSASLMKNVYSLHVVLITLSFITLIGAMIGTH